MTGKDKTTFKSDNPEAETKEEQKNGSGNDSASKDYGLPDDIGLLSFSSAKTIILNYICNNMPDLHAMTQVIYMFNNSATELRLQVNQDDFLILTNIIENSS